MQSKLREAVPRLAGLVGLLSLGLLGAAWLGSRPVPVEHVVVRRGRVASEVMGTGTLEARVSAVISPRVAGLLTRVLVDQGDHVRRGQLLAALYDGDLSVQASIAKVDLSVAHAAVEQAAALTAAASATAAEARSSHRRMRTLAEQDLVSHDDFDKALRRRDVADAELDLAQVNEIAATRQVLKAEAAARYSRERLSDTRLLAPFDGYVVKRARDPGNVAVPGDAILQLISLDTLWIATWIDETSMASTVVGQSARVVFRAEPDVSYEGRVARIEPQVDPETREFLVDVALHRLPPRWGIGQRADVYIEIAGKKNVLLVPLVALAKKDGRSGVFVERAGRARWRPVALGVRGKENIEVLAGLAEGEVIVWPAKSSAKLVLSDGSRIKGP